MKTWGDETNPKRGTVKAKEVRERERRHSTRRNLWCRGANQMVSERPEENCNIPAENTFSRALNSRDSR